MSDNGYEGVTVAGLAIVALDTGLVLAAQRAYDETDDPEVRETWEFPGGHLEEGEEPYAAAVREFTEETGLTLPADAEVVDGWRSEDGVYQGFVVRVGATFGLDGWEPTEEVQAIAWIPPRYPRDLIMRPEFDTFDWSLLDVSGNEEKMDDEDTPENETETPEEMEEPDLSMLDLAVGPTPVHGVLAPEDTESGDGRGFGAGAMTARGYRLPFMWQEVSTSGHNNSYVVGSVDRLMRKDGMIHWEGSLMPTAKAGEFAEMLAFFGRFGVSVDADRASVDVERAGNTGVLWFDAVRAAGLTAVSIPAFAEAYVAFGPHPDMPEGEEASVLTASGNLVEFKRGPGWVTNPKETKRLHDYWTKKGQPGYAKIRWGTPGDFTRAKKLIGEKIAANSPEDVKYLNQIIAQWHHDALGYWPGDLDKPGNKTSAEAKAEREAKEKVSASDEDTWELVLTASPGVRALPPMSYFDRHEDSGALVIEEPDENGIRRTYGYAGEWGVCHIGFEGQCVEVPSDPTGGYSEFHLGRTKTDEGYISTGLITYNVKHRGAEEILSSTAEQAHFDDLTNAWAAVRLGEDERGVWFSGVVLPDVPEEHLVKIEASGQVSGEWKYSALRTLLTVNVPGFPVMRSSAAFNDEGEVVALAASAHGTGECEPTPAERMQALARVDAEVRFAAARAQWAKMEEVA